MHRFTPRVATAKLVSRISCLLIALVAFVALATPAQAVTVRTEPPSGSNAWFYSDINPYYAQVGLAPKPFPEDGAYVTGNCTWYAWGRASEMLGEELALSAADPLDLLAEVRHSGVYEVGSVPKVGALCIGYSGGSPHISVVERVATGEAYVSESGFRTSDSWPGYDGINFHYGAVDTWMNGGILGYVYVLEGEPAEVEDVAGDHDDEDENKGERGTWERISGRTAYDTMSAIVRADGVFASGRGGTVIVATGDGYWDALAASGLAGLEDAPILITPTYELADQTRAELARLSPETILVSGGSSSVTADVLEQLGDYAPDVRRISGPSAPDTAVEIYRYGEEADGWSDTAIIAASTGYWDALSIAPYAFASGSPIFLADGSGLLSAATQKAIAAGGFRRVLICGGTSSVASGVEGQLDDAGIDEVIRLRGRTALDTSREVALWEVSEAGMGTAHLAIASSEGYWDALTAAPVAGKTASVLVLVGKDGGYQAFEGVHDADLLEHGHLVGGTSSLSEEVWDYVTNAG